MRSPRGRFRVWSTARTPRCPHPTGSPASSAAGLVRRRSPRRWAAASACRPRRWMPRWKTAGSGAALCRRRASGARWRGHEGADGMDVVDLFERQVERAPDAIGVRCGAERLTYGELNTRANRLAKYLLRRGAGRDTLVGVARRRSPRLVSALFGAWKAGAAYVPLDPSYPQERLEFMQRDADVAVLLEDHSFP